MTATPEPTTKTPTDRENLTGTPDSTTEVEKKSKDEIGREITAEKDREQVAQDVYDKDLQNEH